MPSVTLTRVARPGCEKLLQAICRPPSCRHAKPIVQYVLCHVLASDSALILQGVDVKADNLACLVGCGAILDVLFFSIAAAGEGILIPAPYYPAFKNDLEVPLAIDNC